MDSVKQAQKVIDVVSLQNKYSLDDRKWEDEVTFCADNDIAFIPWNPINAGHLGANETLKEIADKHDASVFQVGLKWLFNRSNNILLIPGTSKVDHLEENMAARDIQFDREDFEKLSNLTFEG